MEWLAKAYDARDVHLIYLPVDPKWDPYRADPDFRLFSHVVASRRRRVSRPRPGDPVERMTHAEQRLLKCRHH